MNAGINIDPLYCVVADFKVRLPPVMWSQDTRCSASLYISISPLLSGAKICMSYILAIPFLPINSDTAVLKINHFLSWSLPSWKFPVSFYLSLFPSLLFSLSHLSPLIFIFFFNSLTQNAAISSISATAIQAFAIQVQSTSYSSLLQSKIRKIHLHPQNREQSHIFVACISYCIYLS